MDLTKLKPILLAAGVAVTLGACTTEAVVGGAAVGAAAGGVYEYSNKKALEELKDDYEDGKISQEEYRRRKKEIEGRSLVY